MHDTRPGGGGERGRVILGGVVHDEHLAVDPAARERLEGGAHAELDVLGLVEAGITADTSVDDLSAVVGLVCCAVLIALWGSCSDLLRGAHCYVGAHA